MRTAEPGPLPETAFGKAQLEVSSESAGIRLQLNSHHKYDRNGETETCQLQPSQRSDRYTK